MDVNEQKHSKLVLDRVGTDKRRLLKGLLVGTAFVAPLMVSYSMDSVRPTIGSKAMAASSSG